MNNTIRTLQSIIDRNTNEIRKAEVGVYALKNLLVSDKITPARKDYNKIKIKHHKDYIKRKANEQRVLKKLIADEIEIANFNRKFEWEGIV